MGFNIKNYAFCHTMDLCVFCDFHNKYVLFMYTARKKRSQGREEEEEEGVSSFPITWSKTEVTENWKRKHYNALYGELTCEKMTDLS